METRHHVTLKSKNGKTGPITVTRTTTETCPTSCPLLGQGCYDQGGNGNIHRMKHDAGQYNSCTPAEYFDMIPRFSDVFRHNEGGDLWGAGDKILSDHATKFLRLCDEARKVVHCPATWRNVSCGGGDGKKACGNGSPLCSQKNRGYAVGFPAHGNQQRSISLRILG
jgi:hypothetical protein